MKDILVEKDKAYKELMDAILKISNEIRDKHKQLKSFSGYQGKMSKQTIEKNIKDA